ncbi:MAG: primosomal replication protein [Lonepinella koalarum]|nr:primosomal replication protein [Lonepinella koalarum]
MANFNPLIQQLNDALERLYQQYADQYTQSISAKFDRTLFSEDFQPFAFYYAELQHTLSQLSSLNEKETTEIDFLAEKLIAQCTALQEALLKQDKGEKSAVKLRPFLNKREQLRREIDQLPPRERLEKYYEALQKLNEKINEKTDELQTLLSTEQKGLCQKQLEQFYQRRQNCLEAIELLEEYLAFKENQGI